MRKTNYKILSVISNRISSYYMNGEPLTDDELYPLFEAARWAPSSYNGQLWRFIIARRQESKQFTKFLNLLVKANQAWAKNAGALVVVISRQNFENNNQPSRTHTFDAGAAWENLAIEGCARGLVVHGMEGFDYTKAQKILNIPSEFSVMCMIAIGKIDESKIKLEKPEMSGRRPLHEIVFAGEYGKSIKELHDR